MKKLFITLFIFTLTVCFGGNLEKQSKKHLFCINGNFDIINNQTLEKINNYEYENEITGFEFAANFKYGQFITNEVALGLTINTNTKSTEDEPKENNEGRKFVTNVTNNFLGVFSRYQVNYSEKIIFYPEFAVGYCLENDTTEDKSNVGENLETSFESSGFAFYFGGGASYLLTQHIGLNCNVNYFSGLLNGDYTKETWDYEQNAKTSTKGDFEKSISKVNFNFGIELYY